MAHRKPRPHKELLMTDKELATLLIPIPDDANKYTRGSLLILAGSVRFPGAAVLAARAAARAGAGYVTLAIPEPATQVAQGHLLSVPVIAAPSQDGVFAADAWETIKGQVNHIDAIVLGPGLTVSPSTSAFVQSVVQGATVPILIDADALNALAAFCAENDGLPSWLTGRAKEYGKETTGPQRLVLTPHAGELKRLLDATQASTVEALAQLSNSVIVAKGPTTRIVSPTQSASSTTGTAALAKAGTGDVLSGIIGSLLAQGIPVYDAAVLGVEVHGRAGQVAEHKLGRRSVCAEDVLDAIPTILQNLDTTV